MCMKELKQDLASPTHWQEDRDYVHAGPSVLEEGFVPLGAEHLFLMIGGSMTRAPLIFIFI